MPLVTLNNDRFFSADPGVSILDAARVAGITLEYSCRTGRCGICKAPVVSGETAVLRPEAEGLTPADIVAGSVLTCCRSAVSDLTLDIEPLDRMADLEIRTMPARIVSLERLAPDIVKVVLRTPPTSPLRFLPGQYIDIIALGARRSYSLANAPRSDALLELIVKRYPGGLLSTYWFEQARPNDLVRLEGPFGTFFLRDAAPTDLLFLATGTGIAPVRALLEELAAQPERAEQHRIRVYWGNRSADSFCWDAAGLGLDVDMRYLLSGNDSAWTGVRGYVQHAAIRDGIDPANTAVYACGSRVMIASARAAFAELGLPARRFLSDAFVSSS